MKTYSTLTIAIVMIMMTSCQQKKEIDLIIRNATVYTVDGTFTITESIAIEGDKILETGPDEVMKNKYSGKRVIDAEGKPVYPGFIDGHCHFYGYGLGLIQQADLTGTSSFDEILQILGNFHEKHPYVWILGRGWDQNDWEVQEFPDNTLLDKLFPENPVVLTRVDGHAVLANSEALRRASINANTKVQGGEVIVRNGKPTGILIDNAIDLMKAVVPEAEPMQMEEALLEAQEKCFAAGLTSVVDAGLDREVIELIDSLQQKDKLKMRINAMVTPTDANLAWCLAKGPVQTDHLTVNSIKLYADGALGSRGALMIEPYSDDPGNVGLMLSDEDYYRDIFSKAYSGGFQVNTHAIGDGANRLVLKLYGEQLKGKNDRRWRIEHAQIVHPDDFSLFDEYDVIPSIQGTHATSDMYWAVDRIGNERLKGAYAFKTLLEQNGWLVNGTDFPVEKIYPLHTFFATVARKDLEGYPEGGYLKGEGLNREQTLRSMTIWAAKGSFEEEKKGSLEAGKLADLVMLSKDIMTVDESEIPEAEVVMTISGGEIVYQNSEL